MVEVMATTLVLASVMLVIVSLKLRQMTGVVEGQQKVIDELMRAVDGLTQRSVEEQVDE